MHRKRVMMTMTSAEAKTMLKNVIKKATSLLFDLDRNMAFWGVICYLGFFDLTISSKY